MHTVNKVTEGLPSYIATTGEISMKENGFAFEYLTCCINEVNLSGNFRDSLKLLL